MKEQFVTYSIALKLKELGFDEECMGYWRDNEIIIYSTNKNLTQKIIFDNYGGIKSPLWQQAQQWLREKYSIHISFIYYSKKTVKEWNDMIENNYYISITSELDINNPLYTFDGYFNSYEEAREQAVLMCIELLN